MSEATTETFEKTPGWLDWDSEPIETDVFVAATGCGRRALPRLRPRKPVVPLCPRAQSTRRATLRAQDLVALRRAPGTVSRNVVVQATCHGADNRALVDALEHSRRARCGASPGVRPDVGDRCRARSARCSRRSRGAVQFRQASRRCTAAASGSQDIARRIEPTGLARRDLFRGAGAAGALRVLCIVAHHRRRRPHGKAGR